jgi:hypothetical protein
VFEDDPSLLHLSAQGEPDVVLKPCTASGLLRNKAARTIASILGRGPQSECPGIMGENNSFSSFSDRQTAREAKA